MRDAARRLDKQIRFELRGEATEVDRDILEKLEAPLTHLLRNAVDHGIEPPAERVAADKPETGLIKIEAGHRAGMLALTISDDGRGIDPNRLREKIVEKGLTTVAVAQSLTDAELLEFLFLPGFSTASARRNSLVAASGSMWCRQWSAPSADRCALRLRSAAARAFI